MCGVYGFGDLDSAAVQGLKIGFEAAVCRFHALAVLLGV